MNISQPWYVDPKVSPSLRHGQEKTSLYVLVEGGEQDYQKVMLLYKQSPVAGYGIGRVEIVHNQALTMQFEGKVMVLDARGGKSAFQPTWAKEGNADLRRQTDEKIRSIARQNPSTYSNVQCIPMFHGTKSELLDSIFETGFANLATTDRGFFGKGIYNTSHAEYAYRVYSDGTILFNWVIFFSAYPVIRSDMVKFQGGSNYSNYDAHYALVAPQDPKNPNEIVYLPITDTQNPTYDELVVFDSSHVLPRYLITLAAEAINLKQIESVPTGITLLHVMNSYLLQLDEKTETKALLQQHVTVLSNISDTVLNQRQLLLLNIVEGLLVEKDESIKTILNERLAKILENVFTETTKPVKKQTALLPKKAVEPKKQVFTSKQKPSPIQKTIAPPIIYLPFDEIEWIKYFGDVGLVPKLPSNIKEISNRSCPFWPKKKIQETHLLRLKPQTVDGKEFTLNLLEELCQRPKNGGHAAKKFASADSDGKKIKLEYGNKPSGVAYWYFITHDVLPGTRKQGFKDQKAKIEKCPGYTVPTMIEAATGMLTEYVRSGKNLYPLGTYDSTYTNCQETTGWWYQNYVGGLSVLGRLFMDCAFFTDNTIGMAAVLRLEES